MGGCAMTSVNELPRRRGAIDRDPVRPFVKWAGGKRAIADRILMLLPPKIDGWYIEPFVGGGAVFFALARAGRFQGSVGAARLNDINDELVTTYQLLARQFAPDHNVETLIEHLRTYKNDDAVYYMTRRINPSLFMPSAKAARFIFLNKCGYNGLYRVNQDGGFNVPFGRYENPMICDADNLRAVARELTARDTRITCGDFEHAIAEAGKGDVVYCDPPYWPVSKTAMFTAYSAGGFNDKDQTRLRDAALAARRRGAFVLLSNADVPEVRALYADFEIIPLSVRRAINSDATKRGPVGELLIRGAP